jgi:glycerophosphoryl diester phosphodiesterase
MEPAAVTSAARVEFRAAMRRSWVGWPLGLVAYRVCQAPLRFAGRRVLSRRIVRTFRRAGISTQVWTVNEGPDVSLMAEWGVGAVITDRPDAVKRVLDTQPRATSHEP